MKVFIFCNKY